MRTLTLILAVIAFARCEAVEAPKAVQTGGQIAAAKHQGRPRQKMGGMLEKPGSQKGVALVVNAQTRVAESNFVFVANRLSRDSMMNFAVRTISAASLPVNDRSSLLAKENAAAVVVVIDDPNGASFLVAPDERWALVNVAKLSAGLTRPESIANLVPLRARRQVLRAFALLAGSGRRGVESPSAVNSIADLDLCRDALPMDVVTPIAAYLGNYGMTRKIITSYRKACQEGWAPAPTNDAQKAIWDKVHTIPQKPIKIEFDPKTDTK